MEMQPFLLLMLMISMVSWIVGEILTILITRMQTKHDPVATHPAQKHRPQPADRDNWKRIYFLCIFFLAIWSASLSLPVALLSLALAVMVAFIPA